MTNFTAALRVLSEAKVNFIVVGAYAAVLQGSAQVTQDIDICYERTPENMKRLAAALRPHHPLLRGAPARLPFTLDQKTLAQGMNFTLQTDFGDIDLLGELSGVGQFPALARDVVAMDLGGVKIRVASLDAVIRSKRAAGRAKDLNILPELEALKELQAVKDPHKRQKK
jgi:predicted nucleotidyltransferase